VLVRRLLLETLAALLFVGAFAYHSAPLLRGAKGANSL
jgi:hypothetical protein